MLDLLKQISLYVAAWVESGATLIIGIAVIHALAQLALALIHRTLQHDYMEAVRLQLGRGLVLALEFLVAADILRTAVAPSWNEIGQLAAIIALRVTLNYFLEMDIARSSGDELSGD